MNDAPIYANFKEKCDVCDDAGRVCEDHLNKPWSGTSSRADACDCGGAGVPCGQCNPCDDEHPPLKTGMVQVLANKDGSRH